MRRLAIVALLATACTQAFRKDYTRFVAASPRAILVVPAVNKSVDVDASDYFLSTLPVPLAERGYYVFPVNLVKRLLEDDGLADAAMVHQADTARLCNLFGSDAVLYPTIENWTAKYAVLNTQVEVEFSYLLKDCKTGDLLWEGRQAGTYQSSSGQGVLASIILAAVAKAKPDYLPLARQANTSALEYPGPGLPAGPYHRQYRNDVHTADRPREPPAAGGVPRI